MKKILKLLSTGLILINSSIVLIGCRPATLGEIWIITDGGDLFDKAFNQQVIEGSQDFINDFNANREAISKIAGFEQWKFFPLRIKWIISKDGELSTLQNNYNIATYAGAKTIICAGFYHISALTPEIQAIYQQLGVKFILIDALLNNPIDVAGITYAAEKSSYLAALASAIWLVANHEKYQSDGLKMSTYGAVATDMIIENMMGYYWGVYYFNHYKTSDPDILVMINQIRASLGLKSLENMMTTAELSNYNIIFDKLTNSFSGGFGSGTANAKAITSQLINDNKNDIVFPVAGAQTTDLIATIINSPNNNQAKIVGVDVDQSQQYDYAKDYFITSAKKGIRASVDWMLWNSFKLKKENNTFTYFPEGEEYFNGTKDFSPLKDREYTGIFNSSAINAIYQKLIEDKSNKYWDLADKVFAAFKKLAADLENSSDPKKWENAWKTAVDENNEKYRPNFD